MTADGDWDVPAYACDGWRPNEHGTSSTHEAILRKEGARLIVEPVAGPSLRVQEGAGSEGRELAEVIAIVLPSLLADHEPDGV